MQDRDGTMLLVETTITELVEYIDLWNNEYTLNMVFRGQRGKHAAWTVDNVLITGIEIAPGRVLCEFDNFDLQGANNVAKRVTHRLAELLRESFPVNDTPNASRVYGIMARQAARTLRVIPAIFADTSLNAETEADFKTHAREKNPNITEDELSSIWQNFCHLVEQQRTKREEQERQWGMMAEEAAVVWLEKVAGEEVGVPKPEKVGILFLAADPTDASRLRLGEEFREIQEKLKLAKLRDRFQLELPQLSVRPADISQALLDVQPEIVHFSGHGASTGALCFENELGQTHLVQPEALAALFEQFANHVNCVLLNACYSETQAKAIAEHVEYVIGMGQAISDKAAIAFAIGFYQALGAGRTIEEAHRLGCVQIRLQGVPEHLTPVLVKKGQEKPLLQEVSKPQSSLGSRQSPSEVSVSLIFNKDGLVIQDGQELKACLAEALFAAENQLPVTFDVILEPLEVVEKHINSIESEKASPKNRIIKVNLLNQARTLEANRKAITTALPMLLLPPIRNTFTSVDELIESLQGVACQLFESNYSVNSFSLDVFRTDVPKMNTLIWVDEAETEQIKTGAGLKSIFALVGSGWDLFDLPREVRFRKAIPAIILELIRRSEDADEPIDILEALGLYKWSIGLH